MKSSIIIAGLCPFVLLGCGGPKPVAKGAPPSPLPADPWTIANNDPQAETPALLWNGLIGVRLDPLGKAPDGKQQTLFAIDSYETAGEEKIVPLLNPCGISVSSGGSGLEVLAGSYKSALDLKTGILHISYKTKSNWDIRVESLIAPNERQIAQRWQIQAPPNTEFSAAFEGSDIKVGEGNPDDAVWKLGPTERLAHIKIAESGLAKKEWEFLRGAVRLNATVGSSGKFEIQRVISIAGASEAAPKKPASFDEIAAASQKAWAARWQTDIEIEGPVEDQQAVRSFMFYLRSAIHPDGKMSISPMGLSSDIYNGHVFWDADIWVFPALALIEPDRAERIPAYRLERSAEYKSNYHGDAGYIQNYLDWVNSERPTATAKLGYPEAKPVFPERSLKVAWESSLSGRETVPGSSKFEDHVTGSVYFMLQQALSLDLVEPGNVTLFTRGATDFYLQRISERSDGLYDLKGTVSPDENHTGDNDLYTNLLAQQILEDGLWKVSKSYIPRLRLPKDDKTFLTYDNDPVRGYKQAAAILSIYPLQYPPAEVQAKQMMERFADKVTKSGPAMTDSIDAIIWARLGEPEKAYTEWHESWQPFMRPPFLLFSEKRSTSRTYFTTGAAGSLQTVLYGFAGLRIDEKKAPGAQWSMPLKNGKVLSISPHLPKAWKNLKLKNLVILGKRYTFEIANDKVKVISSKI